mmetsp:Transcript_21178/g.29949  ORF Transcript_21178/g.29949 Transcript_21178/m.29949 type:complete len:112 (+) Transcript_21178:128-463(+)
MLRFLATSIMKPISTGMAATTTATSATTSFVGNYLFQACFTRGMAKSCIKTNKSAAKRFRIRKSGSIKRNHSGTQHNTGYRSRSRNNRLAQSTGVKGKAIEKRMRRLLNNK